VLWVNSVVRAPIWSPAQLLNVEHCAKLSTSAKSCHLCDMPLRSQEGRRRVTVCDVESEAYQGPVLFQKPAASL
jgi:hypothetical protein